MAGMEPPFSPERPDSSPTRKRILGLETLLELTRSLVSVQDIRRLDVLVLLTAMGLLTLSRAILLTRERDEDHYRILCRGLRDDVVRKRLSLRPSGVLARRLKTSTGIVPLRQEGLPEREAGVIEFLKDQKITHAAPIRAKGKLKGVLLLGGRIDSGEMTSSDAEMLQSILDLAGIVFDNAELYHDLRQANASLAESNQRLKELDRLKNEFLSNVGHELRTPLTCIIGFAQCLNYPEVEHKQQVEFAANIVNQSEKLSDLIDQVLDLSEMTDKKLAIQPQKGNLNDLILEVVGLFRQDLEKKKISLEMELNPRMPETYFDPARTRRVVRNLLDNAIKFSMKESKVRVSSGLDGDQVTLSIIDEGVGIPKEQIETIFESFRQADGSETRAHGGAGIGLSLAKEIVERQSGSIDVRSQPGKGSVFTVKLPRGKKSPQAAT